jgi:hypothetical protein
MKKLFIFFIAVAMIAAFSVPAAAADAEWSFYGSSRMSTFSDTYSKEHPTAAVHTPIDDDTDTTWAQQGNSRIGANVSAGDIGGRFEYGTGINLRLLYGTWNFGAGTLLVGQTYTPVNVFISNQVWASDNDMLNIGGVYGGRNDAIQVQFGSFKLAFVQIGTTVPATGLAGAETDTTLPKIEAAYSFKTDMFNIGVQGGYNSVEIETDAKTYDVDSYILALHGGVNLGPAYIKANVFQGVNTGNYGLYTGHYTGDTSSVAAFAAAKVKDTDAFGFLVVGGVKLSDMISFEAGYGSVSYDSDVALAKEDDTTGYYIQATIGLAPGVSITPEYGSIDLDKNAANAKEGDQTYFGAKWQINF